MSIQSKAEPRLIEVAKYYIGVTEKGGPNKGPEVERFQKAVDGKAQGEPWCMAFMQYCVDAVNAELGDDHCALVDTEHCLTAWNKHPPELRHRNPAPGRLIVWQFYKNGKQTTSGHVGLVVGVLPKGRISTIEGNTGPASGVVREGDGVYAKTRSVLGSDTMRIKGYLQVWR